jgi:hypothetical protein
MTTLTPPLGRLATYEGSDHSDSPDDRPARLAVTVTVVLLVIGACAAGAFLAYFFDHPLAIALGIVLACGKSR